MAFLMMQQEAMKDSTHPGHGRQIYINWEDREKLAGYEAGFLDYMILYQMIWHDI